MKPLTVIGFLGSTLDASKFGPSRWNSILKGASVPYASYKDGPEESIDDLTAVLERAYPRPNGRVLTPWQRLERLVAEEGFVGEEQVGALLGCSTEDVGRTIGRWGGPHLHYLGGLGVCSPDYLPELRRLIDEGSDDLRRAA